MRYFFFVEGGSDEYFFRRLPKLEVYDIKIIEYAKLTIEKVNGYLKSLEGCGTPYTFFADADQSSVDEKIDKIFQKYNKVSRERICIVEREIESWYMAGVDKKFCNISKIKFCRDANEFTKEDFENFLLKCKLERWELEEKIMNAFQIKYAAGRNRTYNYFYESGKMCRLLY